jgi:hypothetical protein
MTKYQDHNVFDGTNIALISNGKIPKNNTSGVRGVYWNTQREKWEAYIKIRGNRIRLGCYVDIAEEEKARKEAELKYFVPVIQKFTEQVSEKT